MGDLDELNNKLAAYHAKENAEKAEEEQKSADNSNLRDGVKAGAELVVSIGAGTAIGYGLDSWLETSPLFLIIFLLAGIFAGFWNVYLITQGVPRSIGFAPLHKKQPDQDPE